MSERRWIEEGRAMRAARKATGRTMGDEAELRGISVAALSDMEMGRVPPSRPWRCPTCSLEFLIPASNAAPVCNGGATHEITLMVPMQVAAPPQPQPGEARPTAHDFVQWAEKPDYKWCMAQVPDGPGWRRICRLTREEHAASSEPSAPPTPSEGEGRGDLTMLALSLAVEAVKPLEGTPIEFRVALEMSKLRVAQRLAGGPRCPGGEGAVDGAQAIGQRR
jgi:hypothetical protein